MSSTVNVPKIVPKTLQTFAIILVCTYARACASGCTDLHIHMLASTRTSFVAPALQILNFIYDLREKDTAHVDILRYSTRSVWAMRPDCTNYISAQIIS